MNMLTLPVINDLPIRMNEHGLISLNDLHKASGAESHKRPSKWLELKETKELVDAYQNPNKGSAIETNNGGILSTRGVWGIEDLAIDYAQWISVQFKVKCLGVLRAYSHGDLEERPREDPILLLARKVIAQDGEIKRISLELDDAVQTKAYISDKKAATAMNTASQLSKKNKKLTSENGTLKERLSRNRVEEYKPEGCIGKGEARRLASVNFGMSQSAYDKAMETEGAPNQACRVQNRNAPQRLDGSFDTLAVWYKSEIKDFLEVFISECERVTKTKVTHPKINSRLTVKSQFAL